MKLFVIKKCGKLMEIEVRLSSLRSSNMIMSGGNLYSKLAISAFS